MKFEEKWFLVSSLLSSSTGPCWRSLTMVACTTFLKAVSFAVDTSRVRSLSIPMRSGCRSSSLAPCGEDTDLFQERVKGVKLGNRKYAETEAM